MPIFFPSDTTEPMNRKKSLILHGVFFKHGEEQLEQNSANPILFGKRRKEREEIDYQPLFEMN
jgi:hypothetical protein